MQLDNLSLAYLIEELRPTLDGEYVNKVSQTDNGWLKIKLHSKKGSKDLIIAKNNFFISNYSIQAKHGKNNFAVSLKKSLYNKKLVSAQTHDFDRVVEFKFLEHTLVLELLGEGNQILMGKDGKIISCARNEDWADRKTRRGETYIFPKHQRNPAQLEGDDLKKIFGFSEKDAIRALLSSVNIPPLIAEETFFLLKIDKAKPAAKVSEAEAERVAAKIREFYSLKEEYVPVSYKGFVFHFPLQHLKEQPAPIKSLNDFLNELLVPTISTPKEEEKKTVSKSRVSGLEFMQKQQVEAKKKFELAAEENNRKAELIYEHYNEIEELRKAVLAGVQKNLNEKKISEALFAAASKGNAAARLLKKLDIKKKELEL